jgi:4-alpha-glucanotransferase
VSNTDMTGLAELATLAGISVGWTDAFGTPQQVAPDSLRAVLRGLGIACDSQGDIAASVGALRHPAALPPLLTADPGGVVRLPDGTRRAELTLRGGPVGAVLQHTRAGVFLVAPEQPGRHALRLDDSETTLAIAPRFCPSVASLTGKPRAFGVAAQVYALRRDGDGGIGGFGALREAAIALAQRGADALAISPTHALFAAEPGRAGPYAPSSRLALNPLLADPECLFDPATCAEAWQQADPGNQRAGWEAQALIAWQPAGTARYAMLRALHAGLSAQPLAAAAFLAWAGSAPGSLHQHAVFEALHAEWRGRGVWDWRHWPADLRDPHGAAVTAFAADHRTEVEFHLFCQFLAARSMDATQQAARDAGMGIGLIADLAVGMDPAGSHAWGSPGDLLTGVSVGAPPDHLNRDGQGWGLTTFSPTALARTGYAPFLATLRAALYHAGGVRIDHVLGLRRLWLVPDGARPTQGAYLAMPQDDLLRLIALEAHAAGALVIGEDLGTVPEGFRPAMAARGLLGLRVLAFERDRHGDFVPPADWQPDAVAMTSTHDMPPVAGWWQGGDLDWQARLHGAAETAPEAPPEARAGRRAEAARLWQTATDAGLAFGPPPPPDQPQPAVDAAVAYIAATPCALAIVPVEDLLGLAEAPNLPGTTDEHPNWRRRLAVPLPETLARPDVAARLATLGWRTKA